jgi:methylase of polypeptide subunit release factors
MIDTGIERGEPPSDTSGNSPAALFQRQWRNYRKVVDNNYLFHREAYEQLHNLLIAEVAGPFDFLDIACGDASATIDALKGTQIAHYHGIDVSRSALEIAKETLRALSCPVNLSESDFVQAETTSRWHERGHEAGFSNVREVFTAPSDLFRMYVFRE